MSRLDIYRTALLAADPAASVDDLLATLDHQGIDFADFVIGHGLGPLWHERTGREEFSESRRTAEALFLAQEHALAEVHQLLDERGIEYVAIKGAASRLVLYPNPAIRACHDIDLLVRPADRLRAAVALLELGYRLKPRAETIGHEVELNRGLVTFDLHWRLLREGRLRTDPVEAILARRRMISGVWVPHADDSIFLALVHPAFAKHLASYETGLHRVVDVVRWLESQDCDTELVIERLRLCGVKAAAWATLRWVQKLTCRSSPCERLSIKLVKMLTDTRPGRLRTAWLDSWLHNNLSERAAERRGLRLLAFSSLLHDSLGDVFRVIRGRRNARRNEEQELQAFANLVA